MKRHKAAFRRYFFAGLVVLVPIWFTLLVVKFFVDIFDKSMSLLPTAYQPDNLLGFHLPGLGLVFAVVVVLLTGMLMTNFLGTKLVELGEKFVDRLPLVRSIYNAVKQVMRTVLSSSEESFRNVLLVEYPRKGLWSIAFQTGGNFDKASEQTGEEMVTIFIPTTPNPTSGYLMMVAKKDTIKLDISVDQALKMVISLGVVMPGKNESAAQPVAE